MPEIPRRQEQVRRGFANPEQLTSAQAARAPGERIAQFGNDLNQTASNLQSFLKAKKTAKDKITLDEVRVAAEREAQGISDRALRDVEDPDEYIPYFEQSYGEASLLLTENLSGDLKRQAQVLISDIRNRAVTPLRQQSLKRSVEKLNEQVRSTVNASTSLVATDPSQFEKQLVNVVDTITTMQSQGLYSEVGAKQAVQEAEKGLVNAAMDGHLEKYNYDQARRDLTQRFGQFFNQQEIETWRNKIDQSEAQKRNRDLQELNLQDRQTQIEYQARAQANGQEILQQAIKAETPTQRDNVYKLIEQVEFDGAPLDKNLKKLAESYLGKKQTKAVKEYEFETVAKVVTASSNQSLKGLRNQVIRDQANGEISPEEGTPLLKYIDSRLKSASKTLDPNTKSLNANARNQIFETFDAKRSLFGMAPSKDNILRAYQVDREALELSARRGIPYHKAVDQVMPKYVASYIDTLPKAPFVGTGSQNSQDGIDRAKKVLATKLQSGELTKEQAVEAARILKQREDAIKAREEFRSR
jgi:hypothetical protein